MDCDVVKQAYELNVEPVLCDGLSEMAGNFRTDQDNIMLETVKLAEDGSGDWILCLYESKKAAVKAMPLLEGRRAYLCNMLENEEEEIMVNGNEIILDFKAFEVKTVRISYKSSERS